MDFRKTYSNLPDHKLLSLAKYEFNDLIPEAQEALTNELKLRNLQKKVVEYEQVSKEIVSKEDFDKIAKEYRNCECPNCKTSNAGINVIKMDYAYFFIVFVMWGEKVFIGCSKCLPGQLEEYKRNLRLMAIIPPIQTILSLIFIYQCNQIIKEIQSENKPTRFYLKYVTENINDIKLLLRGARNAN